MRAKIETSLAAQAPVQLVKALLDAYAELKDNFNFEKFRPSADSRKRQFGLCSIWPPDHMILWASRYRRSTRYWLRLKRFLRPKLTTP